MAATLEGEPARKALPLPNPIPAARRRLLRADAPALTVKLLTCVGLVAGSATYAVASVEPAAPVALARADVSGLIASRDASPAASRSAGRAAPAVTAPRSGGPTLNRVGVIGVKAIAKPKPKVKPVVMANGASSADARGSALAVGSPGYSGGAYAAAGQALGLAPSGVLVYSAVRSAFGITNIGGLRPGDWGDHGTGHAVDVMITGSGQGDAVASFVMANAGAFHVKYVIWQQRIWMPGGSWRLMEDRGSPTQNHMDHVHISVY